MDKKTMTEKMMIPTSALLFLYFCKQKNVFGFGLLGGITTDLHKRHHLRLKVIVMAISLSDALQNKLNRLIKKKISNEILKVIISCSRV